MRLLGGEETQLRGAWIVRKGRVVNDAVAERIKWLVRTSLRRITTDSSGWDTLYEDVSDGRLWELTYPEGQMHGGGPPSLSWLSADEAGKKYGKWKIRMGVWSGAKGGPCSE